MGFNIEQQKEATKAEDAGVDVHIHGLDGAPIYYTDDDGEQCPVVIKVAGAHSSYHRKAEEAIRKRKLNRTSFTAERIYEDNINKAVACTLDWDGFLEGEDKLPFTKENVRNVYKNFDWVYEQVVEAMHDHARFFGNESNS